MHAALQISITVFVSATTTFALSRFTTGYGASGPPVSGAALEPANEAELAALRRRIETLADDVAGLPRLANGARVRADDAASREVVEEAVRELVAAGVLTPGASFDAATEPRLEWPGGALSREAAWLSILDGGLDGSDVQALWKEAHERGQLHELLEAMEEHFAGEPETAEKHDQRARAYYAAARVHPGNIDGNWWVDSNDAYSRALELDPNHWDARYRKALNMSFWPTAYGGQGEAIRHFEYLVDLQQRSGREERHAKTYLWLGNLYDQQGRTDEARRVWELGLQRHGDDGSLRLKLEQLDG